MEIKGISRKQAGVIYSNIKRGNLVDENNAASVMYNEFVGSFFVSSTSQLKWMDEARAALRNCIDAIFADDMELAQTSFNHFAEACGC